MALSAECTQTVARWKFWERKTEKEIAYILYVLCTRDHRGVIVHRYAHAIWPPMNSMCVNPNRPTNWSVHGSRTNRTDWPIKKNSRSTTIEIAAKSMTGRNRYSLGIFWGGWSLLREEQKQAENWWQNSTSYSVLSWKELAAFDCQPR
jgi:hypothetical protein